MYMVHVLNDNRDWSKNLCSTIPTTVHDLKVKVIDLENFYVKVLCWSFYKVSFCIGFDGFDSCLA